MKALHPAAEPPTPAIPPAPPPVITVDVVRKALSSFGPGSAAGLFGYKPLLMQQCMRAESHLFSTAMTDLVNVFASGEAPSFLVAGGVSIALEKSAPAVRPLACGDPIRRLVAKCFCIAGKDDIENAFAGRNYGVGCKGGVEVSNLGLLKIDRNAFNEVSRTHFIEAACKMFPAMTNWTMWCYGDHQCSSTTTSTSSCRCWECSKATLSGPLYFCCGIMALVNEIHGARQLEPRPLALRRVQV